MSDSSTKPDSEILEVSQATADKLRLIADDLLKIDAELTAIERGGEINLEAFLAAKNRFLKLQIVRLQLDLETERNAFGAMSRKAEEYRMKWGQEMRRREDAEAKAKMG